IRQLEQIVTIVDQKSICKAAKELNMAQSTLSTSIGKLEDYFGEKIFIRDKKQIMLTDFGRQVYEEALLMCKQVDILKNAAKNDIKNRKTLAVSNGYSLLAKDVFIELYQRYNRKDVKFIMKDCSMMESANNVVTGQSEIGVVRIVKSNREIYIRHLKSQGLEFVKLDEKQLCAVVGPKNLFYRVENDWIKQEDLIDYPLAVLQDEKSEFSIKKYFTDLNRRKANVAIGSTEHLMQMVRETEAFTIDVHKEKRMDSEWYKDLRYLKIVEPVLMCEFGYIKKEGVPLTEICQDFVVGMTLKINEWWNK
ncbi:MAG: LysR family transcriptional regulator, partial [Anaerovoracaceae bacterium]